MGFVHALCRSLKAHRRQCRSWHSQAFAGRLRLRVCTTSWALRAARRSRWDQESHTAWTERSLTLERERLGRSPALERTARPQSQVQLAATAHLGQEAVLGCAVAVGLYSRPWQLLEVRRLRGQQIQRQHMRPAARRSESQIDPRRKVEGRLRDAFHMQTERVRREPVGQSPASKAATGPGAGWDGANQRHQPRCLRP